MSSKVTFQIVHGEGNIRFGPDGVDLSDFVMTSNFFKQKTAYAMNLCDWSSDVVLFRSSQQGQGSIRLRC